MGGGTKDVSSAINQSKVILFTIKQRLTFISKVHGGTQCPFHQNKFVSHIKVQAQ